MSDTLRTAAGVAAIAVLAIVADQASKTAALAYLSEPPGRYDIAPFFALRLGFNTGISFGLFQSTFAARPWLLILVQLGIVLALLGMALIAQSRRESAGLGLIVGGAIGNIIDRARNGAVTDFLDVHWRGWHWPTFNVADVAICLGVVLLLFASFLPTRSEVETSSRAHP